MKTRVAMLKVGLAQFSDSKQLRPAMLSPTLIAHGNIQGACPSHSVYGNSELCCSHGNRLTSCVRRSSGRKGMLTSWFVRPIGTRIACSRGCPTTALRGSCGCFAGGWRWLRGGGRRNGTRTGLGIGPSSRHRCGCWGCIAMATVA